MEVYHQYVRLRKDFGRQTHFSDEGAEMLADIRPNEEHANDYSERSQVSVAIQAAPDMSEHEVNTNAVVYATKAMHHTEGGWPKEVDHLEAEHVIRYRKKIEKDEEYVRTVVALSAAVEEVIKANNAIDIYEEYFAGGGAADLLQEREPPSAKTLTVLKDPSKVRRGAHCLSWQPDGQRKIAVAYSILEFQKQPEGMPMSSYVWDITNPSTPDCELTPASPLTCVSFNLKDSSLVGAGQYNGQLAYFDTRRGPTPVEVSPIEHSHRDPLYDMAWLQSKTGTECMTVSTDGMVLWWDVRRLGEPTETLQLRDKFSDTLLGAVSLEYNPAAGPTKFMVGTEQGSVLSCNRRAKNPQDRVGTAYSGHQGPVYGLQRHPFFPKFFLSVGDWAARIWNEDLKTPIITTNYHKPTLATGRWSPTRPGVFFTARSDGALDVWDFMQKQGQAALTVQLSAHPLTALSPQEGGRMLGVAAADGSTVILQLSGGLSVLQPNEKQAISAALERDSNREKALEKSMKEAKIKARKEAQSRAFGDNLLQQDLLEDDIC